jgi:hypothetical protein
VNPAKTVPANQISDEIGTKTWLRLIDAPTATSRPQTVVMVSCKNTNRTMALTAWVVRFEASMLAFSSAASSACSLLLSFFGMNKSWLKDLRATIIGDPQVFGLLLMRL